MHRSTWKRAANSIKQQAFTFANILHRVLTLCFALWALIIALLVITKLIATLISTPDFIIHLIHKPIIINTASYFLYYTPILFVLYILALILIRFVGIRFSPKITKMKLYKDDKQANDAINKFITNKKTRRASMLTGEWGLGKTDFYKKALLPKIKKAFPKKKYIYVSCFGVKDSDELVNTILNKLYGLEWLTVLFRHFRQITTTTTQFKKALVPANLFITLNDFEALDTKQTSYIKLLGLIEFLIREQNCDILIICNINKINDNSFNDFAQKTIGNVWDFSPSHELMTFIINKHKSKNQKYEPEKFIYNALNNAHKTLGNSRLITQTCVNLNIFSQKLVKSVEKANLPHEINNLILHDYYKANLVMLIKTYLIKCYFKSKEYFHQKKIRKEYARSKSHKYVGENGILRDDELQKEADPFISSVARLYLDKNNSASAIEVLPHLSDKWEQVLSNENTLLDDAFFNHEAETQLFMSITDHAAEEASNNNIDIEKISNSVISLVNFIIEYNIENETPINYENVTNDRIRLCVILSALHTQGLIEVENLLNTFVNKINKAYVMQCMESMLKDNTTRSDAVDNMVKAISDEKNVDSLINKIKTYIN